MENNQMHREGQGTKAIENQTAKLPSDTFLFAALGCIGLSVALKFMGKSHTALLVGQWAPSLLIMGLYNKVVKVEGHDKFDKGTGYESRGSMESSRRSSNEGSMETSYSGSNSNSGKNY